METIIHIGRDLTTRLICIAADNPWEMNDLTPTIAASVLSDEEIFDIAYAVFENEHERNCFMGLIDMERGNCCLL